MSFPRNDFFTTTYHYYHATNNWQNSQKRKESWNLVKPIRLNYTNNFSLNRETRRKSRLRTSAQLIDSRSNRKDTGSIVSPFDRALGFLVVGSNEPCWCLKWKQDDRVYTGMHGRSSRRSRFHRRGGESRASRVSRCVLPLLGIVIGDKFSTACPADIDFLPAWRHAYKLRPLQLIGAFTFERHVINCRLEEKTRDGNAR